MDKLLETVAKWGVNCGLDEFELVTAQSLAWHYRSNYSGPELPDSHWARLAVRAAWNGRDLPGCALSTVDALNFVWQGAGMKDVQDKTPPPDVLASHKELLEKILAEVGELKAEVAELRIQGVTGKQIAVHLNISEGRISQIAREIAERFQE